jgi:glycosyltransferase involved in cell wall biosynthesis
MKISIVTPTYNEEDNIKPLSEKIFQIMANLNISYEQIIIDNCSTDNTQTRIRELAKKNKNIKAIFNLHDYGQARSPYYAMINTTGDAVVWIDSDFQNPPEVIIDLIKKWKNGSQVVLLRRQKSEGSFLLRGSKNLFYKVINYFSNNNPEPYVTGVGIYDRSAINILKTIKDPIPYLRGLIFELGLDISYHDYDQKKRNYGQTKNNFFTLFDFALTGLVKHTQVLRIMIYVGILFSLILFLISILFLILKLIFWNTFSFGLAPIIIGLFFIGAIQILFLGLIGEYISIILTYNKNLPLVLEKERINF